MRAFRRKFGYHVMAAIEGNAHRIAGERAGRKRVMDGFASTG
jgi:hypothetical protein